MSLKYNSHAFLKVLATSKHLKAMTKEELERFINDTENRLNNKDYRNLDVINAELQNAKLYLSKLQ